MDPDLVAETGSRYPDKFEIRIRILARIADPTEVFSGIITFNMPLADSEVILWVSNFILGGREAYKTAPSNDFLLKSSKTFLICCPSLKISESWLMLSEVLEIDHNMDRRSNNNVVVVATNPL